MGRGFESSLRHRFSPHKSISWRFGRPPRGYGVFRPLGRNVPYACRNGRPGPHATSRPKPGKVLEFTGGPPDGSKERPFTRRDSEALSLILTDLFMDVRFNLRSQRIEWCGMGLLDGEDWTAINRRILANLRERIARQYFVRDKGEPKPLHWGRDTFTDTLDALVRHREADPLLDWLERLPAWDGNPKLSWMLGCCFDVPDDELSRWGKPVSRARRDPADL